VGELLDSATLLLRDNARVLVPVGAVLAVLEQLLLHPLRLAAGAVPPLYGPPPGGLGAYWLLLAAGAATETVAVALLANLTARAAAGDLLGHRPAGRRLLRPAGARYPATALVALLSGAVMLVLAVLPGGWLLGTAVLGFAVPALVLDRVGPGRSLLRSASLALRPYPRAAGVRLLGQTAWLVVRVGVGLGCVSGLRDLGLLDTAWAVPVAAALRVGLDAVAYPALACLDAVVHLETRMRTEGLDIHLAVAARSGPPTAALLAVPR
jgi:hypothetical protein